MSFKVKDFITLVGGDTVLGNLYTRWEFSKSGTGDGGQSLKKSNNWKMSTNTYIKIDSGESTTEK